QAEVAAPYVDAGIVDYFPAHGKTMQCAVYNDAVKNFKFHCRHMAFIDADEFIFPKTNQSIVETLDEILLQNPNAAGVAINWQLFGSNNHESADYSVGVLERFTRRAPNDWAPDNLGNNRVKTIANPRKTEFVTNPHYPTYFGDFFSVNENGAAVTEENNFPVTVEKIAVNHYYTKSREEFARKIWRGRTDIFFNACDMKLFDSYDRNEIFDDGILKYRAARAQNFSLPDEDERLRRVAETLTRILSAYSAGEKISLETALTCRALSACLYEKFPDKRWKICEEASLAAILNSSEGLSLDDGYILVRELPPLLYLPYPAAKYLREVAVQIIRQLMERMRTNKRWKYYFELDYLMDILKFGG
ncbi:MAG: glycosyltransferase family 92 protein, partial [Selenomonadaceae bacterium]|nr:glycosyltransferase family 92 protein [Selenomonadaceae bacterium]